MITDSLEELYQQKKLDKNIVLWGVGDYTRDILQWLGARGCRDRVLFIVDNFKAAFCREYGGVRVLEPDALENLEKDSFTVLLSMDRSEGVRKQLAAGGVMDVYNLRSLGEKFAPYHFDIAHHFTDRVKGKKYLCYILAGYDAALWDGTLGRIEAFQDERVDYCLASSGKQDKALEAMAERNGWSYLWTETNQVCFIQNLVIDYHPRAEYIIKMDEDIFIGREFFNKMIEGYHKIEREGEYRIGFTVPVVPLNCCGFMAYLKHIGRLAEYEERFGRAYITRFSAAYHAEDAAEFLWDTMGHFDDMADRFLGYGGYGILDSYYNIGCIMYSRKRWMMMGRWPEVLGEDGMGRDEACICQDNADKDMVIYELHNVLAGHLAFGHQKKRMKEYYREYHDKFMVR